MPATSINLFATLTLFSHCIAWVFFSLTVRILLLLCIFLHAYGAYGHVCLGGLFSKTEMSEVLTEILKVDPSFDKDSFLKQCERDIIPNVLEVCWTANNAGTGVCVTESFSPFDKSFV